MFKYINTIKIKTYIMEYKLSAVKKDKLSINLMRIIKVLWFMKQCTRGLTVDHACGDEFYETRRYRV